MEQEDIEAELLNRGQRLQFLELRCLLELQGDKARSLRGQRCEACTDRQQPGDPIEVGDRSEIMTQDQNERKRAQADRPIEVERDYSFVELLHLSHGDGAACNQDGIAEKGSIEYVLECFARLSLRCSLGRWVCKDDDDKDAGHCKEDHDYLKALYPLFQEKEGKYESHKWTHVVNDGNHGQG